MCVREICRFDTEAEITNPVIGGVDNTYDLGREGNFVSEPNGFQAIGAKTMRT